MRTLFIMLFAWLCCTLAGVIFQYFQIDLMRPDLLAIFVFYVARTRRPMAGMLTASALALLVSGFLYTSPSFLVLQAIVLLFSVYGTSKTINLFHPFFVAAFLFAMELLLQGMHFGLSMLYFGLPLAAPGVFVSKALAAAGMTALLAPWLHILLARIETKLVPAGEDIYLLR